MNRFKLNEMSPSRIINGVGRRFANIPNKIAWSFSQNGHIAREKLKKYKDIHAGQRCFLIANGPSLNKMDLKQLKNEITFGLNRIYLNFENMEFETNYLVCVNELVLRQFKDEIIELNSPKFINWSLRDIFIKDDKTNFIYKRFFSSKFGKDTSISINSAATVTYAALQIIYYMGFSEVIIIGLDHNFVAKSKIPNVTENRTENVDINHFHPNYFPKGSKWETPDLISSEYFYKIARKEFENDGREILDCTLGGKCTIFNKIDFNSLF